MSKQKGYISWQQLVDGEMWADLITWESIDDAKNVDEASCRNLFAQEYYSFIDQESVNSNLFSTERNYSFER